MQGNGRVISHSMNRIVESFYRSVARMGVR